MNEATGIARPDPSEYNPYFERYIGLVAGDDAQDVLRAQSADLEALGARCPGERETYRYAPGKWSVRELLGHMTDTERVMMGRALWFARGVETPLPGMEQDDWAAVSNAGNLPLTQLVAEAVTTRKATLSFLQGLTEEALSRVGNADGNRMSARAAIWIVAGHQIHHMRILEERYGLTD